MVKELFHQTTINTDSIFYRELSESIIGAAMLVLNTLKPELNEKAYERTSWSSS